MVKMAELSGRRYRIDDDIPIPSPHSRHADDPDYEEIKATAAKLEVGQSFLLPARRTGVAGNLAKATGHKFTQRTFKRGPNAGMMRIWRIE